MTHGYCNPLNLPYRFQIRGWAKEAHRESADPSVVVYQGRYWLFPSKSGGYWHSPDLHDWYFVKSNALPVEDYAPDVCAIDGQLIFTASREPAASTIFRSSNPLDDQWEKISDPLPYTDPKLFQDDDGRVYLYWGCSNSLPLFGVEMDRTTLMPIGEKAVLIHAAPEQHGWERSGDDNTTAAPPWIEGMWMNKHNGRYYLQYAAPGTQFNVYGDGVYTSSRALGPFEYAEVNPFSFKPGGFINGAGHGSTFTDLFGNLWHISTMRISVKHMFERRLGLWPAGYDADGVLYANTSFGDYPTRLPTGKWNPWTDPFCGWMLLSYDKPATASSSLDGYAPALAVNEDVRNYWSAATGDAAEWLRVDLETPKSIHAVQINFAEHQCEQFGYEGESLFHQYLLEGSLDGSTWFVLLEKTFNTMDVPHDYNEISPAAEARYVRVTNRHMPGGGKFAISSLRVFGLGHGNPPAAARLRAKRDKMDERNANLTWNQVPEVTGYNLWWGPSPQKLYSNWMIYGHTEMTLRCLNVGQRYWMRVDSFNENGVTTGVTVPLERPV
jgi:xylan 1,4-beta-xylosidase